MAEFSVTSAGFEGFSIIRRKPATVAVWAGVYAAMVLGVIALVIGVLGAGFFTTLMQATSNPTGGVPDFSGLAGSVGMLFLLVPILVIAVIVVSYMLLGAVNRVVLRPEQTSIGYLRLGGDEGRIFLVRLVLGLLALVVFGLAALVVLLLARVHILLGVVGGLAAFCGYVFAAIKLSLAVPMTFATKRVNFFGSWGLTKGHFWPIFGAYALAVIAYFGIVIVLVIVFGAIGAVVGVSAVVGAQGGEVNPGALLGTLGIFQIIQLLVQCVVGAAVLAIFYGPPAAIYKALAGDSSVDAF